MDMRAPVQLLGLLLLCLPGATRALEVTQTPATVSAEVGGAVTIDCKTGETAGWLINLAWYQQKPCETPKPPKLLIYDVSTLADGVPDRFKGSGSGTSFTLTIDPVKAEDAGIYYCYAASSSCGNEGFGDGTVLEIIRETAAPIASIFPPDKGMPSTGTVSIVCIADKFYPSEIVVTWKVDGVTHTTGIQESKTAQNCSDNTYSLSSILTLDTSDYNSNNVYTCEITHAGLTSPLVKSFNRNEC